MWCRGHFFSRRHAGGASIIWRRSRRRRTRRTGRCGGRLTVARDEGTRAVHVLPRGQDADDRAGIRRDGGPGPDDPPHVRRRRLARRGRAREEEAGEEQGEQGEEEGPGGTGSAGGARHRVVEGRGVCGFGGGRSFGERLDARVVLASSGKAINHCCGIVAVRWTKRPRLRRGGPSSPLGRSYRSSHVNQSLNMHVTQEKMMTAFLSADVGSGKK